MPDDSPDDDTNTDEDPDDVSGRIVTDDGTDVEAARETPGGDKLTDVDPEYDYSEASETWIGERSEAELQIESLDGTQVKRFKLVEPADLDATMEIVRAFIRRDKFAVCASVVDEPDLNKRWDQLTGREQAVLYDRALGWIQADEFVDAGMVDEMREAQERK